MVDSSGAEKGDFKLLKKSLKWTFNFRFKQDLYFILQRLSFQEEEATLKAVQANTDCKLVKKAKCFHIKCNCTLCASMRLLPKQGFQSRICNPLKTRNVLAVNFGVCSKPGGVALALLHLEICQLTSMVQFVRTKHRDFMTHFKIEVRSLCKGVSKILMAYRI